jgi:predicted metalloprotease with PDZ domain
MRRLHASLLAAGLLTAPLSAVAGPRSNPPDDSIETFEWSMSTSRARLGVTVIGLTPELRKHFGAPDDKGVMVGKVAPKSAAAAAGLAVGDILVQVKGTAVDSATDVLDALADGKKGEAVDLEVIRDGKPITISVTLTDDAAPRTVKPRMPRWFDDWFDSFPDPWGRRGSTRT